MADFNSSLPVRTETAGDLDIFISDATTPTQKLKVNADGSIDTNFASGSAVEITDGVDTLAVNGDGSINAVVTATDLDIRDLSASQDNVAISDGTDTLAIEADGSINVNAAFAAGTKVQLTDGVDDALVSAAGELQTKDDGAIALLTTIDADTSNLDVALSTRASEATLSTVAGDTTSIDGKLVDGNDIGDVTINNAAGASAVNIQDGGNSITIDDGGASLTVDAADLDIRDLTSVSDSVEVLQSTHDDLNANANLQVGDADVANGNPVPMSDAGGSLTVDAVDLDIRDLSDATDSVSIGDGTDTLAVNTDGSINVKISDRSGVEQLDYDTAAAVASAATSNHDYTTTGAFRLEQVHITASSRMKAEIQIETAAASGVFNTAAVLFTSESDLNADWTPQSPPLVASGARVRVIRTNRDNQAQDLYSTITGFNE